MNASSSLDNFGYETRVQNYVEHLRAFSKNSQRLKGVNYIQKKLHLNPLSANPTKWSNTLKQLVGNLLIILSQSAFTPQSLQ